MSIKHYKILIPDSVKIALRQQVDYIVTKQHAPSIASEWIEGLMKAIESLSELPDRCSIAPENLHIKKNSKFVVRNFIYKRTFRIIFMVVKDEVRILSVKHSARLTF